jgi:signal peptidase II
VRRSLLLLVVIAGSVLAFDLWTKHWAHENLRHRAPVEVIGEFVRLTYTRNSGVAFGLGAGVKFPYYLFSIAAAVIIITLFVRRRAQGLTRQIALSLILGGALGNLVDRVRSGEVVDFIEVGWSRWHWPVFNVADSAVTIGVLLFALAWHRTPDTQEAPQTPTSDDSAAGASLATGVPGDEPVAGPFGPGAQQRGAAGSFPRGGADGPLT